MGRFDTPRPHPGAVHSKRCFISGQFLLLGLNFGKPQLAPDIKLTGLFGINFCLYRTFLAGTPLGIDAVLNASLVPVTCLRRFILVEANHPGSGIFREELSLARSREHSENKQKEPYGGREAQMP